MRSAFARRRSASVVSTFAAPFASFRRITRWSGSLRCWQRWGRATTVDTRNLVICLLYLRNIGGTSEVLVHAWSLALEEQFYVLWPSMSLLPRSAGRAAVVTGVLILVLTIARTVGMVGHFGPPTRVYSTSGRGFDSTPSGWGARSRSGPRKGCAPCNGGCFWSHFRVALRPAGVEPGGAHRCRRSAAPDRGDGAGGWSASTPAPVSGRLGGNADANVGHAMAGQAQLLALLVAAALPRRSHPRLGILRVFPVSLLGVAAAAFASYVLVERPFLRLKAKLGG